MATATTTMALTAGGALAAAQDGAFVHPVLRVPKLAKPPTIDGRIEADEWGAAAAFTGVAAEGSVGGHGALVPEAQQVVWYLGYDDTYLYLAMRSPHPEGTYPVARVKEDNLLLGTHPAVLFEDHVEIQILTHGRRDQATTQGKGFYKIMANPKGALIDQYLYNNTPGTEEQWSIGGPLKCHVTPTYWDLELAVEIRRLGGLEKLDGRDLVIQLVRTDSCTGMYFAGWVGAPWLSWNRFAQVSFVPDTPAFRLLELGEIGAGELAATVELVGGGKPADLELSLLVEDADGKPIHAESRQLALAAGERQTLEFRRDKLPISTVAVADRQRRNQFEIKATAKIGKDSVTLYHNRSPFMQFDDEFRRLYFDPWLQGRPQSGEWEFKAAYLPYANRLEASVDLDFFGMPAEMLTATRFAVDFLAQGSKEVLGRGEGPIAAQAGGPILVDLPDTPPGDYVARFELFDEAGRSLSTKQAPIVRQRFDFEHNQLGISDEVIHPFIPLSAKDDTLAMWGRTYQLAPGGLLRQIVAAMPSGNLGEPAPLLAAPMRLELLRGGQTVAATDGTVEVAAVAGQRIDVAGSQQLGPLRAELAAFLDFDGWYEAELRLAGQGTVDALDLVVDLRDAADTLYVQRASDGRLGNFFGDLPRQPGVHFRSTDLPAYRATRKDWKSFVPQVYVGDGDRGLWFFAWSDAGWELRDDQPAVQVERLADGTARLRVRLLAGPVDLEAPRALRFALQAAPVKPNHPRFRSFGEDGHLVHDTRGYRYYGMSVDDFANQNPEDFEALRQFVLYGQRAQTDEQRRAPGNYGWWHGSYMRGLGHGAKLTMYGSGRLTGVAAPEFRSFGGEWLGNSNWPLDGGEATFRNRWNYQGTTQWKTSEQLMVKGINWTSSFSDFFIWYHKPLLEKSGFNGTWWDNVSIFTVREYNPALGRMEEIWSVHPRRQLMKRLNVLGWQLMRPPMWMGNMHVDLGWNQVFWMVENDWYADGADMTSLDQWPLGEFRAMARTKSTMQVAQPWLSGFRGTTPALESKIRRSLWGMMLSHDIVPNVTSHHAYQKDEFLAIRRTFASLRGLVNLTDTGNCLFAGYWRTASMVRPAGQGVRPSVYTNPNLRAAAIVLFNTDKQDQYLAGTALDVNAIVPIRGKRLVAHRIFDLESGQTIATAFEDGKYIVKEPLLVNGEDFRLLGLEVE